MISSDEWLKQYLAKYNVTVEIWETALLINAEEIIIDGKRFLVAE